MQKTLTPNIKVTAQVNYVPSQSKPDDDYYFFAYSITITNAGNSPAQLISRHWTIADAQGNKEEVKGPGVIGLQPKIQPGQTFQYDSACPLPTATGSMTGRYHFLGENGETFMVEVPEFYLICPLALH